MKSTRLVVVAACVWLTSSAYAEPVTVTLQFEPDIGNGAHLYELCSSCHMPEGLGLSDGTFPKIAGQHMNVLLRQLVDIRTGRRDNPLMYPFVQQRTLHGYQDMVDVALYISTLSPGGQNGKGPHGPDTDAYAAGKTDYESFCQQCHGEAGEGNNDDAYPKLQGQHYRYLLRQLDNIKSGRRHSTKMLPVVVSLPPGQLEQILSYVSYLPDPAKP